MTHHAIWENMSLNPKSQYDDELMVVLDTLQNIANCGGKLSDTEYLATIASQFLCLASRAETMEELEQSSKQLARMIR